MYTTGSTHYVDWHHKDTRLNVGINMARNQYRVEKNIILLKIAARPGFPIFLNKSKVIRTKFLRHNSYLKILV